VKRQSWQNWTRWIEGWRCAGHWFVGAFLYPQSTRYLSRRSYAWALQFELKYLLWRHWRGYPREKARV